MSMKGQYSPYSLFKGAMVREGRKVTKIEHSVPLLARVYPSGDPVHSNMPFLSPCFRRPKRAGHSLC